METKYPTLKRPKRKLCYLNNPDSPIKKWTGKLSLRDIGNMFDGLDSPSADEIDIAPLSPLHQTSDNEKNQSVKEVPPAPLEVLLRCPMGPKGDALNPSPRSPRRKLNMASPVAEFDMPFKGHGPIKTSSPIEENMAVGHDCGDLDREKDLVVSPILLPYEGEEEEEAQREHVSRQKPQTNGHSTQKSDDFEIQSPPVKITLSKPKMSCHKKEAEGTCKESQPIKDKTPRKPEKGDLVGKRKTECQEKTPVPAVRQETELKVDNKKSESVKKKPSVQVSTCVKKDFMGFLQKLRDAGQAKLACSMKSRSPVKVTTPPPEPEDDFCILEDETPLWISIPTKGATSKKQRQSTSSDDKNSSVDKEAKERKKGKEEKKTEEAKTPELSHPEHPPSVNLTEQGKPNQKKQRLKKVPSKESDKAEEQTEDAAASDKDDAQKPSENMKQRPSKERKENAKKGRPKKVKEIREKGQELDARKKALCTEALEGPKEESGDPEAVGSRSDEEVVNPEAQAEMDPADGNDEQNKAPLLVPDGSSSKGDQIPRRRKQQKSKQIKELNAAAHSPVALKKEKVLKRKGKTERTEEFSQIRNKAKEKKSNKIKSTNKPCRMKATKEVPEEMEAEQVEERDEVPNEDGDERSSPLDLTHRGHSLRAGDQVFQRFYNNTSAEKRSITTAPASPRGPREQLTAPKTDRRKRKPPGNWWLVGSPTEEEEENLSSQPQPKEPKLKKERKKRMSTPKNINVAVSSKPQGGAPVPPLNVKPQSAPKTVKRSVATFNDIFTSHTETPTLPSNRGAGQANHTFIVPGGSISDEGVEEVLSMEAEEVNNPLSSMIELQEYEEDDYSGDEVPAPSSPRGPREQLKAAEPKRRKRKPPGNWWLVGSPTEEEAETPSSQPQPKEPKLKKERKKRMSTPKNINVAVSSKPQGGAPVPPLNVKPQSAPKTVKRSVATFNDIFTSHTETPTLPSNRGAGQKNTLKSTMPGSSIPDEGIEEVLSMETEEVNSPPQHHSTQNNSFPSVNTLKAHRSGPCSMIELQEYEDEDCSVSKVQATLSASDLWAPPLKPLVLQPKDKDNLTEWFSNLWSTSVNSGPKITPDQFDWYFYQGRVIGFLVDLNCGTICNGKMLLGSYMKKPLWVDHSATSVFNLFTSSVSVTINGSESRFSPGQSFMVPCGQAYSIKNISAQPAVLCFTRILAESLD